jgi:probable rRNA maturation factor
MDQIKIIGRSPDINQDTLLRHLTDITRQLKIKGDITIKLGGKPESRKLNATYLNRDYATDVLSFPIRQQVPEGFYLGDIFICLPVAREQARANRVTLENEILRLMIHGILHLSGMDHEIDSGEMLRLQEELLAGMPGKNQNHG